MSAAWLGALAAVASALLVGGVRWYALRGALLDVPSERSSHRVPTPRGGGLGVVATCLAFAVMLPRAEGRPDVALALALGAAAAVAVIGWLDDHGSLPVAPRLAVHVLAGLAVAWLARGVPGPLGLVGAAGAAWWAFWTVSAINVTNFIDGIDGLIGLQVLVFGLHVARLGGGPDATTLGVLLAGTAAGFLAWNWAPARIFLGDVGSAPLGVLMVVAGVLAQRGAGLPITVVFAPLFPIFLDAAATLVVRWRRGERLTEAHRSHLYQRLANGGWGHARTSAIYGAGAAAGVMAARIAPPARPVALATYFLAVVACGVLLHRGVRVRSGAADARRGT
jgi:Fuc2NAc and GlcNAc transferase